MNKAIVLFAIFLAGCAGKGATDAQIDAAIAGADSLQESIADLGHQIDKACGGAYSSRFSILENQAKALRVQIQSIAPAAKADIARWKSQSEKRGIIILGLLTALVALGYVCAKKAGLRFLR